LITRSRRGTNFAGVKKRQPKRDQPPAGRASPPSQTIETADRFATPLWRCPACETVLTFREYEQEPRLGVTYRCQVCRLELALDDDGRRLIVAPLPHSTAEAVPGKRR
jgi:hypothetical protein